MQAWGTRTHAMTNSSNGPCAGPNAGGPYAGPMVLGPCAGPYIGKGPCAGPLQCWGPCARPLSSYQGDPRAQRILKEQRCSGDRARVGAEEKETECIAQDPSTHSPKRTMLREPAPYAQLSLQCPQLRSGSCNVAPKRLSLQLLSLAAIAHEFGMYRRL